MSKELPSALKGAISLKKANKKSTQRWGLISSSLVSVVPLGPPTGKLMYFDSVYDDNDKFYEDPESFDSVVNKIREEVGLEIPKKEIVEDDFSGMHITSIPITAPARKIKATWDPSLADDLMNLHSIDAEAELTAMADEIDKEIMKKMLESMNPKVGISSRYAKKKINPKFYGTIEIKKEL